MDQKFKKILQKTKDWNQGVEPLSRTFEGALFKESAWPFYFTPNSLETVLLQREMQNTAPLENQSKVWSLVLFVGDTYAPSKSEDLLGKMIGAMKLSHDEVKRFSFDETLEDVFDLSGNLLVPTPATVKLLDEIRKHRPSVVVTLGATVTNILLGKREKLSSIHGQFFEKALATDEGEHQYSLMPIFHPDFLLINPNMKRTAWIDLQKVMERVGKI